MPDVFILVSPDAQPFVAEHIQELGLGLRVATSLALLDATPEKVSVMAFSFFAGDNASPMQIFCVASTSPEREDRLRLWGLCLAEAWHAFATKYNIAWGDAVDAWPIMPPGYWLMANEKSINEASCRPAPRGVELSTLEGSWVRLEELASYLNVDVDKVWRKYLRVCVTGEYAMIAYNLGTNHGVALWGVKGNGQLIDGAYALGSSEVFSSALPKVYIPIAESVKVAQALL